MTVPAPDSGPPSANARALVALERMQAKLDALDRERSEPIAIVGMACRLPGGIDRPEAFWALLRDGRDAISEVPPERWDAQALFDPDPRAAGKMTTRWGGFIEGLEGFDAAFFGIAPREARRMDPQQRLLMEVAWHALEDAGETPERLAGSATGVFLGISSIDHALCRMRDGDGIDELTASGEAHAICAGRLSYTFDLKGPSVAVDTACSAALFAIHLACQSLRSGESSTALVGGVNVLLAPEITMAFSKGGFMAADGRCKTFDARADGYVRGEGCVVLVLKRLSRARADGNRIAALIRGSAANQDGRTAAITAPSGLAQQAVIRQALDNAGIEPARIGYVEAHGSGTALGDAVELEALVKVFGRGGAGVPACAIGALKTAVGHLEAAAGIAGLLKAVLALQHRAIPPVLHFSTLNPYVDLTDTRLVVPTTLRPWDASTAPRCAGVSAFGFSGTNVHVVLEEAPEPDASVPGRPAELLLLSAKSPAALEAVTDGLAAHLVANPAPALADLAYTLQVGRVAHPYRYALVCSDREEAAAALAARDPAHLLAGVERGAERPIVFMFPGVGDHYVGMARQLYDLEPTFRRVVDHCCDVLEPVLGVDLRAVVYPPGSAASEPAAAGTVDLRRMLRRDAAPDPLAERLCQTHLIQPLTFVLEYALAQLLLEWGLTPEAMIGHSIGEWVAACVAGVFALDDALVLVATRARLVAAQPPGAMVAVPLTEQQVRPLLDAEVVLAAVNAPSACVLSCSLEAVGPLEVQLSRLGVQHRRLATTHAFHSPAMQPVAQPLAQAVAAVPRSAPRIPFVSNLTGDWITPEMATSPAYWGRHLCETVRFAEGVATLAKRPERALLEVGPGQSLGSFARQHCTSGERPDCVVLPTLRHAYERHPDVAFLLRTLGRLWLAGARVDWRAFQGQERRRLVSLPPYPFEGTPYPLAAGSQAPARHDPALAAERRNDVADWFQVPVWKQSTIPHASRSPAKAQTWLVLLDEVGVGTRLAGRLAAEGAVVVTVTAGSAFARRSACEYVLDPGQDQDYDRLLRGLRDTVGVPDGVVHLWTVGPPPAAPLRAEDAARAQERGLHSVLALTRALADHGGATARRLFLVSSNAYDVLGEEGLCPEKATLAGPCRVVPMEYPQLACRGVDVTLPADASAADRLADLLARELEVQSDEALVAYRGTRRWVQTLDGLRVPAPEEPGPFRQRGVYLITGGLGGLGLAIAKHLATSVQARLVLVGRSGLPPRDTWDAPLAGADECDAVRRRIAQVQDLERGGAEVLVLRADVTDRASLRAAVDAARARFGAIHGVIHAAGVAGSGLVGLGRREAVAAVLAPKVTGTLLLQELLEDEPLDLFVLFSSVIALTGVIGGADYAAANAFLDAFARHAAHHRGLPTLAINWGGWQWDPFQDEQLAALPDAQRAARELRERVGISFAEGTQALRRALVSGLPQVVVSPQDVATVRAQVGALREFAVNAGRPASGPAHPRPALMGPYVAPRDEVERTIASIWEQALGIEAVGVHDNFLDLGGHSLMAMQIRAHLLRQFDVEVSIPRMFADPTIAALAGAIAEGRAAAAADRTPTMIPDTDEATVDGLDELSDAEVASLLGRIVAGERPLQ